VLQTSEWYKLVHSGANKEEATTNDVENFLLRLTS
jgi:hypothetical protein